MEHENNSPKILESLIGTLMTGWLILGVGAAFTLSAEVALLLWARRKIKNLRHRRRE